MSKITRLSIGSLLALLLLTPLVAAFGVTAPYWKDNPLNMYPGQTQTVTLRLQNMVGNEDIALKGEVTDGEEIASLVDTDRTYLVAFGQKNVEVPVEISIPENTPLGGLQEVEVTLTQVPIGEEEGILEISGAVITNIPINIKSEAEVVPPPSAGEEVAGAAVTDLPQGSTLLVVVIILGLILIIAAVVVANRLKNERRPY